MQAGNQHYNKASDLPRVTPLFPLEGALLLPGGNMPLNVFEPRYLALVDDCMRGGRVFGMIQPRFDLAEPRAGEEPQLCQVGCLGRITAWRETGDGRYLLNLSGICRFRLVEEVEPTSGYRQGRIAVFEGDLADQSEAEAAVDRAGLLSTFKAYLDANEMEADWDGVSSASTETLVNFLSMMSPYGAAEKQALLEAEDLKTRAETLVAITEIALAREAGEPGATLQ